jgi:hypothetical protein
MKARSLAAARENNAALSQLIVGNNNVFSARPREC